MWFKVKITTKALPVLQKTFPLSTTCTLNQLSKLGSYPATAKPPLPTAHTPPWLCLFTWGVGAVCFQRVSTDKLPKDNFLIIPTASKVILQAPPASSPSSLSTESRTCQKSLSCLAFPPWSNIFQEVVDLACRI